MLHVHFVSPLTAQEIAHLRPALVDSISISEGSDPLAHTTILVAGRPTREQVEAVPDLRALIVPWAGLPEETRALMRHFPRVAVHNLHHNAAPVAELAVMLLLAAAKFAVRYDQALRGHDWRIRYNRPAPSVLLAGKTALILGYGAIGRRVAAACRGLGMVTLATRRSLIEPETDNGTEVHPAEKLTELLPRANALIICLPHTPATDGLLRATELDLLPPKAILVNIGRGRIVDEAALYDALRDSRLHAAGLDVWYSYPPDKESRASWPPSAYPFHELDNIIMSPHRGGATNETDRLRMAALAELLNTAAEGRAMGNRVDLEEGY